jgi:glycine oxidase
MLAMYSERDSLLSEFQVLAKRSLALWPTILSQLPGDIDFQQHGSLCVAHPQDQIELQRYENILRDIPQPVYERLSQDAITALEPALHGSQFSNSLFFLDDGAIHTEMFYDVSTHFLQQRAVAWHVNTPVEVSPYQIKTAEQCLRFDSVFDCRGLGAKKDISTLRGVRGELLVISHPNIHITRPIRVMHPRYAIYVVPRRSGEYIVGATSIESEDDSPVSVQSAMELLSALYVLHPNFAEARIIDFRSACRPAFLNHLPAIDHQPGLLRLNGLYRHGYMLGPALVELALGVLS